MAVDSVNLNTNSFIEQVNEERNIKKHQNLPKNAQISDSVHISSKKKVKRNLIVGGAIALTGTMASLALCIGRNPVKAAKVLKGTVEKVDIPYQKGQEMLDDLLSRKGDFKIQMDDLLGIFSKNKENSNFTKILDKIPTLFKEHKVEIPKDVAEAIVTLRKKSIKACQEIQKKSHHGDDVRDLGEKFAKEHKPELEKIYKFLDDYGWKLDIPKGLRKEAKNFSHVVNPSFINYINLNLGESCISRCPQELLPANGVFYHGTKKAGKIYKDGFSPFVSKQINEASRELGAGVYLTPDPAVASFFSGLNGRIIPVKVHSDKVAMVTEESYSRFNNMVRDFLTERMPNLKSIDNPEQRAMYELLNRHIFKKAGYDAAYIPKGVKGGGLLADLFKPNINEVIGKKQSQVVVFSPEKLEIQSRSLGERISDLKLKMQSLTNLIKWSIDHPFGF